MKSIKNIAASFFVVAVTILSVISVMGVWDIFDGDVIVKSFQTLGLLAFVAVITMAAGQHMENRSEAVPAEMPSPLWGMIRKATLTILIVSVSLLALLGVLSIWEIIQDKDILYKSLSSLTILAFGALIIVVTCRNMEGANKQKISPKTVSYVVKQDESGIESISKQV